MIKLEVIVAAFLRWLVDCLYNASDTTFVVRILCVVAIQISHSLLCCVLDIHPILHKIADILDIHKLDVV